ncbi:MAG: 2-oxo acid dehydrogenase subunit E2 [Chitinophagaceae bacterium]|nr:2-oxo acid dehydrogenase subunit E2 [Chitinophagaceae bacterium]
MAIAEIIMPKMGESIMEATILRWHKKVGDYVKMDETLLDIATDKVDSEVPSTAEGVIKELVYDVNDVVPVGGILARIETEVKAEALASPQEHVPIIPEPVMPTPQPEPVQYQPEPVAVETQVQSSPEPEFIPFVPQTAAPISGSLNNRFFSPLVLNIANSEGLSLSELERIPGTGADGRVSKKDVLQYIADKRAGKMPSTVASMPVASPAQQSFQAAPIAEPIPVVVPQQTEPIASVEPVSESPAPFAEPIQESIPEVVQQKADVKHYPINVKRITDEEIAQMEREKEEKERQEREALEAATFAANQVEEKVVEDAPSVVDETPLQEEESKVEVVTVPVTTEAPKPEPAVKSEPVFNAAQYKNAEIIEMDRMRKLIAKHMVDSVQTSPHVTSFTEADVTNMVTWRNSVKTEFEKKEGMKITFTPMFMECILKVMKQYPIINSSVVGDKIIMKKDFNIGMATALPTGNLIVPVIKNAGDMNFISLTRAVNTLAENARKGKLSPDDVMDGTFTLTNVGTFGSLMGTPIINQPQVAILAVGEIKKKPVVIETDKGDFIGIRHMMYLSMSYDHRIIDGSIGASFLRDVAKELEAWDVNRQLKYVVKEWYVE